MSSLKTIGPDAIEAPHASSEYLRRLIAAALHRARAKLAHYNPPVGGQPCQAQTARHN